MAQQFLAKQAKSDGFQIPDPGVVGDAFVKLSQAMLADPGKLMQAQMQLWQQMGELWQRQMLRAGGEAPSRWSSPTRPTSGSRTRRGARSWCSTTSSSPTWWRRAGSRAPWPRSTVSTPTTKSKVGVLHPPVRRRALAHQLRADQPTVLKHAAETKGESLLKGLRQLLDDLERGKGDLKISMTNEEAFQVGENIAVSPGKVIFQNELMQLLQYEPTTDQVYKRPLLIVPPWINKFYILDLKPKNSFIKFAVDQGFTVFVISWANPGRSLAHKTFENYLDEGPLAALGAIEQATGEREATVIGYCLGGTLTACLLAWMAEPGRRRGSRPRPSSPP